MGVNNLYVRIPPAFPCTRLLELHSQSCDTLSARYSVQKHVIASAYSLDASVHVQPSPICSLTRDPGLSAVAANQTLCRGVLAILASDDGTGSQAPRLCQEGVRADLCYMLPSIREQITHLGGERERGHGGNFKRARWLFLPKPRAV